LTGNNASVEVSYRLALNRSVVSMVYH